MESKPKTSRKVLPPKAVPMEKEEDSPTAKSKKSPRKVLPPKGVSVSIELPSPLLSTPTVVERVETTAPPIVVEEVKKVYLKRFEHAGKFYYKCSETDELYEYLGSKKRGIYCGRYDSLRGCIVKDAPESDYED